jgi:hypothetical protein
VTRLVLRYWKLEPIKDVALLQVGNTPLRIAAILSGQVDGGLINVTDLERAINTGCCEVIKLDAEMLKIAEPLPGSKIFDFALQREVNKELDIK